MFATLLLGLVGSATTVFLGAIASGSDARRHISDPALESALAVRRLSTLAPGFRTVLSAGDNAALLWLSDRVPSCSVHLSEAGLLYFDRDEQELVLETVRQDALTEDRTLERVYLRGQYGSLMSTFEALRDRGLLSRQVLAEGVAEIEFTPVVGTTGSARARFRVDETEAAVIIAPAVAEEPLR
jgi:hypothetical protein